MQIGVVFPQTEFPSDPVAIRDYAQTVEGLGYRHLLVYDHVLGADLTNRPNFSGPYHLAHPFQEVLVFLGYLAGVTSTLELVTGVLILPQRQTALVAKQAAEIDVLSGGRLRLGIGVGWNDIEFKGLDKEFHNRGERSEEQIAILRALWTEPVVTIKGRWETILESGINPRPVQRPIPIWIGGYAEATLRRVGIMGDGWFPWREPNDAMKIAVEKVREYAITSGRDPATIGFEPQLNVATGTPDTWHAFIEGWRQLGATHLCLGTMNHGLTTPSQHLKALDFAARELGVSN